MSKETLPVAVIGAGPVGLAAVAHLVRRGENVIVFEASENVAGNVRSWGHVRVFSPWRYNIDTAARELLEASGWQSPNPDGLPTGNEIIQHYLRPLAELPEIEPHIHFNTKVVAISRHRIHKAKDTGRENAPFAIRTCNDNGKEETFLARAIIDATGTWSNPNPLGANGIPAIGEDDNKSHIFYGIPDISGKHKPRYANQHVAVVGGGHSAINALLELVELQQVSPQTTIHWILQKASVQNTYGGLDNDELPARGALGMRIKQAVDAGEIHVATPFFIQEITTQGKGITIIGETPQGTSGIEVDEIISATGSRPDFSFLSEVRYEAHSALESTPALAPLIDPNIHSCGSVPPHGEQELRQPEKDFYIVGVKSYGRAPTFLMATGYEQVRSVVAGLAGDWEAAENVELSLPETGVCGVPAPVDPNTFSQSGSFGISEATRDRQLVTIPIANVGSACCEPDTGCC